MKIIPLTQGYNALVDNKDYKRVKAFKWCATVYYRKGKITNVYATHREGHNSVRLHRFVLGVTDPSIEVDHEDHDGLNNRRRNLRKSTTAQNQHNQHKRKDNKSGFKGVYLRYAGAWVAQIRVQGKRIYLGQHPIAKKAALAYDLAATKAFGKFACTNKSLGLLQRRA